MERDLTHGSIGRNILRFSLPYFYRIFTDTIWNGRFIYYWTV